MNTSEAISGIVKILKQLEASQNLRVIDIKMVEDTRQLEDITSYEPSRKIRTITLTVKPDLPLEA